MPLQQEPLSVGARLPPGFVFCTPSLRLIFEIHPTRRRSLFPGVLSLCVQAEFDFNLRTAGHTVLLLKGNLSLQRSYK